MHYAKYCQEFSNSRWKFSLRLQVYGEYSMKDSNLHRALLNATYMILQISLRFQVPGNMF